MNDNEGLLLQQNIDTSPFRLDRKGSEAATLMACVLTSRVLWMLVHLLAPICSTDVSGLTDVLGRFDDPLITVDSKLLSLIHLQIWVDSGDFAEDSLMFLHVPYESPTPRLPTPVVHACGIITYRTVGYLIFKRFPSALLFSHTPTQSQFSTGCLCTINHSRWVYTCTVANLMFLLFGQNPRDIN